MASLTPLNEALGIRKAKHLLRRASFNYSKSTIDAIARLTPLQAVEQLLKPTTNKLLEPYDPLPKDNPDGYWLSSDIEPWKFDGQNRKRSFVAAWWIYNAINETSLKHKLSFFLHSCFTVAKDDGAGTSSSFFDYVRLLDHYAYGNIKTLATKITLDNSMLIYLNNTNNKANNPNENYAREYLELFTILKGEQIGDGDYTNYTESDVVQAARVFSGFRTKADRTIIDEETGLPKGYAHKNRHDSGDKQFSSAFNNTIIKGRDTEDGMMDELQDFTDMIFDQEETAKAYCRKLYRYFVKSEWDETVENTIINELANTFRDNNYEIIPVVRQLLESKHFYDEDNSNNSDEIIGSIVKSPLQLFSEVYTFFKVESANPHTEPLHFYRNFFFYFVNFSFLGGAGLNMFSPDSVAGYPAHYQEPDFDRHWFSSTTIISRYKLMQSLIYSTNTIAGGKIYTTMNNPALIEEIISDPSDPYVMIEELATYLYPEPIDSSRIDYFIKVLMGDYSPTYWAPLWQAYKNGQEEATVKYLIDTLLIAMVNATEFQVM